MATFYTLSGLFGLKLWADTIGIADLAGYGARQFQ
jgi:hypothetical protein